MFAVIGSCTHFDNKSDFPARRAQLGPAVWEAKSLGHDAERRIVAGKGVAAMVAEVARDRCDILSLMVRRMNHCLRLSRCRLDWTGDALSAETYDATG